MVFEWAVIGAGPAGIAVVAKLLDYGIDPKDILWIDPQFQVGDLGAYWSSVSSNTKVKYFNYFLQDALSFAYEHIAPQCSLSGLDPEDTCALSHMVQPLQLISDRFVAQVVAIRTMVHHISLSQRVWSLQTDDKQFTARHVVLATGAVPSSLNYPGVEVLPFDSAISKDHLSQIVNTSHCYGVFGSSHSAMIIIRHLVELGVKKVINFYRSPCRYALELDDCILFDNTGLKGQTAAWTREHIDGVLPANLVRYNTSDTNIARFLPECDQVIYAVGFQRRNNIVIGDYEDSSYNARVGIMGPGLFGFGIAYPEVKEDIFGNTEAQVGLWKFMTYLNRVLPVWVKYHC